MSAIAVDPSAVLMRQMFRRYASGVMVVTYRDDEGAALGMTATSVCSVSVEPPTMLACVNRQARTHQEIVRSRRFALSLLAREQRLISEFCAQPGTHKCLPDGWVVDSPGKVPVIAGALGSVQCRLSRIYQAGSHSIFVGSALEVQLGPLGDPLLYFDGSYRSLGKVDEEASWLDRVGIIW